MKIRAAAFYAVSVLLAAYLLVSCQPLSLRDIIFEDQMTQLQARSIQSRAFEMTDQIKAMRAVITTLQDLDWQFGKIKPQTRRCLRVYFAAHKLASNVG